MLLKRILYSFVLLAVVIACSTKKNAVVNRAYHNLTARYNGYYYSGVNLDDGVYKVEKANKENFDKILPIYIYPAPEKAKATFPEFDKAIKKSSLCIQKHAIKDKKGNEIASAGKWIDNNWINIGIAHFYKREFFSAIESFEYVIRTYNKSNDKFTAMMWLIKANNEIGSVSSSEPLLGFLKNERKLPNKIKNELPLLWADYYIRRGQYTEAVAKLMEATRNTNIITGISKKNRARYAFIIGQLSEILKDNHRAVAYYNQTIQLKPNYELVFYSKIKIARLLDVKRSNSEKTKKGLLKMAKEFKNSDYFDVIYFTLGEIEEKENNRNQAMVYYKKSVKTSVNNPKQKALSFLKLGEINFDLTNYQPAEAYYDSTIAVLPADYPDYNAILARKKTLETLVGYIRTISREDSLQRIAKMSDADRNAFITKMMANLEKEAERKRKEKEAALLAAQANGGATGASGGAPGQTSPDFGSSPGAALFYFYNPSTIALGVADFVKRWGQRKHEDNWRRSNKALTIDDPAPDGPSEIANGAGTKKDTANSKSFYLKDLPLSDSLMHKSNAKIIKAYYMMGSIYKEELNNPKKTIASFEELNTRFPDNKYALKSYYILYRVYLAEKNNERAEYYKNKILNDYPDSEIALLIKNPDYAQELNAQKSEVEKFYVSVYETYTAKNYADAFTKSKEGVTKFGKSEYLPKFEFIKAMSYGKLKGIDSLEYGLKLLVAKYPNADVTTLSEDILTSIKKQKNPEIFKVAEPGNTKVDTFAVNFEAEHFLVAITTDDQKIADGFKKNLGTFNSVYYSEHKFEMNSNLFGLGKQMVVLKTFTNAKEVMSYYENVIADPDMFKGDVKKDQIDIFPIFADNLPLLYKKKNVSGYKLFFEDNYAKLKAKN